MNNEVHGHEVINMISTAGKTYTRTELRAAIVARFGVDATFCTCSVSGMSPDGMIDFLKAHGKFVEAGDEFTFNVDTQCGHHQ
jgi:probable metal-binding protein